MGVAGNAELIAAVSEADRCAKQLKLESVRQDPPHMRFWLDRYSVVCERLLRAAAGRYAGAPYSSSKQSCLCMGMCGEVSRHVLQTSMLTNKKDFYFELFMNTWSTDRPVNAYPASGWVAKPINCRCRGARWRSSAGKDEAMR